MGIVTDVRIVPADHAPLRAGSHPNRMTTGWPRVGTVGTFAMAIDDPHRRTRGLARGSGGPAVIIVADSSEAGPILQSDERYVGVVTRAVSWVLDAIVINLVAIMVGLGAELFFSIIPVRGNFASVLKPVAAGIYVVWCGAYFVVLWWWTGQTIGARVMQVRLLAANRRSVGPAQALVRWVGMNLAMVPLFAGFLPILFGRRGFPDWLARTQVLREPQPSRAERRLAVRAASRVDTVAIRPGFESNGALTGDGTGQPLVSADSPDHATPEA
jgi:uncharacterized RDD family membrane protein YckC